MDPSSVTANSGTSRGLILILVLLIIVVAFLGYKVYELSNQILVLADIVATLEFRVNSNEADLRYIIPMAENANMWAHSH